MEKNLAAKIGAVCYIFWGLVHFNAASGIYELAQNTPASMTQGRLMQIAFYVLVFATAAIVFAVTLNWRNDRLGFWANGTMVAIADIPFILFILVPGYAPWWPGGLGPILWIAASVFTALAQWPIVTPRRSRGGRIQFRP